MKSHIALVLATGSSIALMAGTASADIATPADSGDTTRLDEIVVNARRVDERLQDVPITVTAVSSQTLADMHIDEGADLIKVVPTLSVQQGAQGPAANYAIRGIRDGVVTYFNEVPINTVAIDDQIWDMASIQALAGPAGTLFGENATGGVILFVPQKPTKELEGYIDASYGNYNYQQVNAVVNLPVNDMLQFRLGGRFVKHDPFVENTLDTGLQSEDRQTLRASMLFEPTSTINDYMVVDYGHRNEDALALISSYLVPGGLGAAFYGPTLLPAEQAQQNAFGIRKVASPFPSYDKANNLGASNIFTASFDHDLTLKYILGFRHSNTDEFSSKSGFTVPIEVGENSTSDATQWTNEVQLLGSLFDQLHWTVGYYNERSSIPNLSSYELFGLPGQAFSVDSNIVHNEVNKDKTQAGYAQGTYAITDKINLTAGGRYTKDTASIAGSTTQPEFFFYGPQVCGLTPGASGVDLDTCTQSQSLSTHAVTYNVSLDYHLTQGVLLYATNRKGYNAGGFNASVPNNPPPGAPESTYKPEFVTDYELGVKTEGNVAGAPFRANFSVYVANYTQIQRTSFGVTPTGTYDGIANGPKARIDGAQLEAEVRPFHDFTLMLNYGYLHTEYVQGAPGFPVGNVFGQAPEHTLNVSGTYRHDLTVGGNVLATASYAYQSQISFMDDNIGLLHAYQDGYGVGNARLGWESIMNSKVDVSLFVKNFTNVAYALEKQDESALLGFTGTIYNDPRTYGVEMHYRF